MLSRNEASLPLPVFPPMAPRAVGRSSVRHGRDNHDTIKRTGQTIGPPALNEYAVEPVGVLTNRPSAQYVFTNLPSRCTSTTTMLAVSRG